MTVVDSILMVLTPDGHTAEDELERYSLGDLSGEECARVEEHLLVCETCRERLEEQDLILGSMTSAATDWRQKHPQREKKPGWRFPRPIPLLAAVLVLVSAAVWLSKSRVERLEPAVIALNTTRGAAAAARAPAHTQLDLRPDFAGLAAFPHYVVELVDRLGSQVFSSQAAASSSVRIPPLQSGTYFVRLYSPAGELLREYALQIEN